MTIEEDIAAVERVAGMVENTQPTWGGQLRRLVAAAKEPRTEVVALDQDVETLLRGFDEGIFVRDIARDIETGWAVRLLPFLGALGRLSQRRAFSPLAPLQESHERRRETK